MIERIKLLEQTRNNLKKDFVGIDKIIDRVIEMITPWYLTPEILERPTVISLWGLTGTGKTCLTRKLIQYLGISGKSLFFDCGEQISGDSSRYLSDKLEDLFDSTGVSEDEYKINQEKYNNLGIVIDPDTKKVTQSDPLNYTFVFDEFQFLKTKNEQEDEIDKPESRAIWNLIDSGLVDITNSSYKLKQLTNYIEDFEFFLQSVSDLKIKNGRFYGSDCDLLKNQLSYFRWAEDYDEEKSRDKELGYNIIFNDERSQIIKRLNLISSGLGFKVGDRIREFTKLSEYIEYIKPYIDIITKPRVINCSKSLIFILGNLDEAFGLRSNDNLDPDVDADVYNEITRKVNVLDIKKGLRKRFRDEQVGRLGNNIIIYPSLRKKDFETIISRELTRISEKFKKINGIDITYSQDTKKFIYSEGVIPIFGARQVFATINSFITPVLSRILLLPEKPRSVEINIRETKFETDYVHFYLKYEAESGTIESPDLEYELNIGSIKNPDNCIKLAIQGVHEASHAVLYSKFTGEYPSAIIASSILGGGFMMEHISKESNIESKEELRNNIIVSLAGYYGEREFYDEQKCTMGASSDINEVWNNLVNAFYRCGFDIPLRYSNSISSEEKDGTPYGFTDKEIQEKLYLCFLDLCEQTKAEIKKEKKLIGKIALYLAENRSMPESIYKEYIDRYGSEFNTRSMEKKKQDNKNYYLRILKSEIE